MIMGAIINLLRDLIHNIMQFFSFGKTSLKNSMSIYVKTNVGSTINVDLDPKWDIKNVKQIVGPKLGIDPNEVKIIFAGKELSDSTMIEECDLGHNSILHAIKIKKVPHAPASEMRDDEQDEGSKPFSETLIDLQITQYERQHVSQTDLQRLKAHFYVSCSTCKQMRVGKLRVRCANCKDGAFTVHSDPQSWDDVLLSKRITGECHKEPSCSVILHDTEPTFAEFYFKCAEHKSAGGNEEELPLYLIKPNLKSIPCLACSDVSETVLVFPCNAGHVTCLECFQQYCVSRLQERQFWSHPEYGYTLPCPVGCPDSFIKEIHHFHLLKEEHYDQYQRFAAEEYVLQAGGVLCPQPGCGMGILLDDGCDRVTCLNGCGFVFCRKCKQGYHLGDCDDVLNDENLDKSACQYHVDPNRVDESRWDVASKVTIRVISKPCPKCRTATERSGGCMHMVCTRPGCSFEWCWVCQTTWTRDCMGAHWFG